MGNLKSLLAKILEPSEVNLLYSSYDVVGDIAIIKVHKVLKKRRRLIAESVMKVNKHVKTVLCQTSPIYGDFRLRRLEWIAGERKTETVHKEYGCTFKVDLEKCYFSPRLLYERMRIAEQVQPNEIIVNMFSGVGSYSIIIAKHSSAKRIFSIDINSHAIEFMKDNIKLNKVEGLVIPFLGDAKNAINLDLRNIADRVLMPLPERASEYLYHAILALKPKGGYIHYYDFEYSKKDENPLERVEVKVSATLQNLEVGVKNLFSRVVRTIGPNWFQVIVDLEIFKKKSHVAL